MRLSAQAICVGVDYRFNALVYEFFGLLFCPAYKIDGIKQTVDFIMNCFECVVGLNPVNQIVIFTILDASIE